MDEELRSHMKEESLRARSYSSVVRGMDLLLEFARKAFQICCASSSQPRSGSQQHVLRNLKEVGSILEPRHIGFARLFCRRLATSCLLEHVGFSAPEGIPLVHHLASTGFPQYGAVASLCPSS